MIIIKCSQCRGLMKIDDSRLPVDEPGMARCPHCGNVCDADRSLDLSDQFRADAETERQIDSESPVPASRAEKQAPPGQAETHARSGGSSSEDNGFLFPAEQENQRSEKRTLSFGGRIILWASLSVIVVAFFALAVNVILPGPPKSTFGTGINRTEEVPADTRVPSADEIDRRTK